MSTIEFSEEEVIFLRELVARSNISGNAEPSTVRAFASIIEKLAKA